MTATTTGDIRKHWKRGDRVWACAYEYAKDKGSLEYKQKPVEGILTAYNTGFMEGINASYQEPRFFVPFKKPGKGLAWSRAVSITSRCFADTRDECENLYNGRIREHMEWHRQRIKELEDDKI